MTMVSSIGLARRGHDVAVATPGQPGSKTEDGVSSEHRQARLDGGRLRATQ